MTVARGPARGRTARRAAGVVPAPASGASDAEQRDLPSRLGADSVVFEIAIPEPELRLALPQSWGRTGGSAGRTPSHCAGAVFRCTFRPCARPRGEAVPHVIESITRWQAQDVDVGKYEELRIRIVAPAVAGFDPHRFSLHYDAVIHQVPNHFALVYLDRDFHTGRIQRQAGRGRCDPLRLLARCDTAVRRHAGFRHAYGGDCSLPCRWASTMCSSGVDHLLFLASLLIVAPLRAVARRWSLFQGWRYTLRRFLGISLAFTAGHSLSLLLGAYRAGPPAGASGRDGDRPLGAARGSARHPPAVRRQRMEDRGRLRPGAWARVLGDVVRWWTGPLTRACIVLGFNLGVEGAQLVAMACAVPLLYASRWRGFHVLRIAAMACVVVLALVWIAQRAG